MPREQPLCSPGAAARGERGLITTSFREREDSRHCQMERGANSDSINAEEGDDGCSRMEDFHDGFCKIFSPVYFCLLPLVFFP